MLVPNPVLEDFPSETVRQQFKKIFSGQNFVPTSPKIHELRTRQEKSHAKTVNPTELNET
jgi:hypothetical protein